MAPRISSSSRPILCAVLDVPRFGGDPRGFAEQLFLAGVDWIQLRDRAAEGETLWRVACELVAARDAAAGRTSSALHRRCVVVNKRVDIALASGADGVHLGGDAIDARQAARLLPDAALIGVSLHSPTEVESHADLPIAYAQLAPIWDPLSKPATRPALGIDRLARAARLGLPLIAQGGLDPERAAEAIRAGAAGIAVTGMLGASGSPGDAVERLREALDHAEDTAG